VVFSPDSRRLVTASWDGTARLWDAADGRPLECLQHSSPVWTAAFSADGQRLLTATGDEQAIVWDLATGAKTFSVKAPPSQNAMRELDQFPSKPPFTAAFSLDELRVITGSQDQTIRLWDPVAGGEPFSVLKGNAYRLSPRESGIPFSMALSPDGERLITGGFDQVAALWPVHGQMRLLNLRGHEAEIGAVAFAQSTAMAETKTTTKPARVSRHQRTCVDRGKATFFSRRQTVGDFRLRKFRAPLAGSERCSSRTLFERTQRGLIPGGFFSG
jgi:WD40 repeat protein